MKIRITILFAWTLFACSTGTVDDGRQRPAVAQPKNEETRTEPDAAAEVDSGSDAALGFCQDITLHREACGVANGACDDKTLTERTCSAGGSAVELCILEIASGDLYTLPMSCELEDIEGRLRACTEEEKERWHAARR